VTIGSFGSGAPGNGTARLDAAIVGWAAVKSESPGMLLSSGRKRAEGEHRRMNVIFFGVGAMLVHCWHPEVD
jgi:hypothetical protein